MHRRLKSLSLATATLLLSLTSPLLPLTLKFEPLVVQAQTTQDRKAEVKRLQQEGLQLQIRGQFREALEKFQQALVIVREIGDRAWQATLLDNLGSIYSQLKQDQKAIEFYQQAIELYQQVLAISRKIDDRNRVAAFLYILGWLYNKTNQHKNAIECFQQASVIFKTIREEFNNFTRSPEVLALVTQRSPETLSQDLLLRMGDFNALQDNLKNLQQKAVLLYPLILDDRLELILTTPDSPPIRRTVQVPKKQLNKIIAAFRSALQNPTSDAKIPAQQLYNWLIKPLEADLKAADAQTLIYALTASAILTTGHPSF